MFRVFPRNDSLFLARYAPGRLFRLPIALVPTHEAPATARSDIVRGTHLLTLKVPLFLQISTCITKRQRGGGY